MCRRRVARVRCPSSALCVSKRSQHALKVYTQWVRHRTSPFSSRSMVRWKVDFQGSRVTSDGGLILVRELDGRLGFSELVEQHLTDSRGKNTQLPLADLVRQSVYSRLAGFCFCANPIRDPQHSGGRRGYELLL